jgi:hypothetical protein
MAEHGVEESTWKSQRLKLGPYKAEKFAVIVAHTHCQRNAIVKTYNVSYMSFLEAITWGPLQQVSLQLKQYLNGTKSRVYFLHEAVRVE